MTFIHKLLSGELLTRQSHCYSAPSPYQRYHLDPLTYPNYSHTPYLTTSICTGIRGLDLSKNLIPSWDVVADITSELSNLRSLRLK